VPGASLEGELTDVDGGSVLRDRKLDGQSQLAERWGSDDEFQIQRGSRKQTRSGDASLTLTASGALFHVK
jgi:hypothetical protein